MSTWRGEGAAVAAWAMTNNVRIAVADKRRIGFAGQLARCKKRGMFQRLTCGHSGDSSQIGGFERRTSLPIYARWCFLHPTSPRLRIARERLGDSGVLNKFGPSGHGEAQVQYLDGDFRVISPGTYVRCAVTEARIPLDELKYWSVDLQEAYAVPSAVLQRHFPAALKS